MSGMHAFHQTFKQGIGFTKDFTAYCLDASQRAILMADVLRQRGNVFVKHELDGQPPVLAFDYEMVLDGRILERPVNYSLVRIMDRRTNEPDLPSQPVRRRRVSDTRDAVVKVKRPVLIIDPRAGHGPGIGGFKEDSEIGVALDMGHPVYFLVFYTHPEPGQTIADVQQAEILFIETVVQRHPDAPLPAVIGNCQAGWAAALVAADRPDIVGPLVFNASPLSYWAGVEGKNPMRYKGGLLGGVWLASLMSDLGGGLFDGAHLVAGFEDLNPANTYWSKLWHVYANVDDESQRFLDFERWWNGFYLMTGEEIHFIVENLFVGNKLARGQVSLSPERTVSLKRIREPVIVFASNGDNITPPQQALNWIPEVWESADEIAARGQTIIYIMHETIGHLGIFVSGKVARREHRGIIGMLGLVDLLSPGLYEMVIVDPDDDPHIEFLPRRFEDILAYDDGRDDETEFTLVARVSGLNDHLYRSFVRPWLQPWFSPMVADALRRLHPLRLGIHAWADPHPAVSPLASVARMVRRQRLAAPPENLFRFMEARVSDSIRITLDWYRDIRDLSQELLFKTFYHNPWMQAMWAWQDEVAPVADDEADSLLSEPADDAYVSGGLSAALMRIMVLISSADAVINRKELSAIDWMMNCHPLLAEIPRSKVKQLIADQSRLVSRDRQRAIASLPEMIPDAGQRKVAVEMAECMAVADKFLAKEEGRLVAEMITLLKPIA